MELENSTLITLIIFLVAAIFIFGVYVDITNNVTAQTAKQACKLSIQKKVMGDVAGPFNPFEVNCPRRIIKIEGEQAEIFNLDLQVKNSKTKEYTFLERTEEGVRSSHIQEDSYYEDVHAAIGYEMVECWETMGSGQVDVFNDFSEILPGTTCMVCAEFHLTDSQEVPLTATDVRSQQHHLLSESARRYKNIDDYLYGKPTPANAHLCDQENYVGKEEITLSNQEPLAIVYYRRASLANDFGGGGSCQAVDIVPIKELPGQCGGIF